MGLSLGDIGGAFATGGLSMIPGGMDFMGDLVTGGAISNAKSVENTNQMQMALADKQMGFQERMSNTAYERAMADMRKSGLNPMLAYDKGGASTPTGAMANLTAPRKGDVAAGLFNTAKTIATEGASIQNTQSQTKLNEVNQQVGNVTAEKLGANAQEARANVPLINQQLEKEKNLTKKAQHEAESARLSKEADEAELPAVKAHAQYDKDLSSYDAIADRIQRYLPFVNGSSAKSLPSNNKKLP